MLIFQFPFYLNDDNDWPTALVSSGAHGAPISSQIPCGRPPALCRQPSTLSPPSGGKNLNTASYSNLAFRRWSRPQASLVTEAAERTQHHITSPEPINFDAVRAYCDCGFYADLLCCCMLHACLPVNFYLST